MKMKLGEYILDVEMLKLVCFLLKTGNHDVPCLYTLLCHTTSGIRLNEMA
jgi:hypothetical protein